ncbi:MAG: protoporphyrinogen oxidase [Candidatus Acidiferrales bacterium]
MTAHVPVLVVGAGISGLACAYYLRKSGIDAHIVESSPRPGGMIRSERREGYLLELGPQSFSSTLQLGELCRDLGIANDLVEAPPRAPRFLLLNGQLRQAPLSPPAFFTSSLFSLRTKASVLRDLFGHTKPPDADESVAAFVRRKFSAELLDKLVGPFVSGIYAGDAEKLSLRAAFPQLHEAERSTGSIIRGMFRAAKSKPKPRHKPTLQSFLDGNETLIKALAVHLGPALRCGMEVVSLQHGGAGYRQTGARFVVDVKSEAGKDSIVADHLVLATPPNVVATLLKSAREPVEEFRLNGIEFAPIAVVSLGYPKSAVGHSLDGFGYLIPRSEKLRTLGTVWNSSLFPDRAPEGHALLTSFIGGATDPGAVSLPTEDIADLVHRELVPILSVRQQPVFANVQLYERALPQYNLGHLDRITRPSEYSFPSENLWLAGNYLQGPAIGACIEQAKSIAQEICSHAVKGVV